MTDTQLIVTEFAPFEKKLIAFQKKYDTVVYDLTDPAQEKQAKSDKLSIGKVISSLDKCHKAKKAPLKEETDLLDSERKRIKDSLLITQGKVKSQIEEHDREIREHAEELQGWVENIEAIGVFGASDLLYLSQTDLPNSDALRSRLEDANALEIDDRYEHRKADAKLAADDVIKKLEGMLESRLTYEEEQVELEKLRKEEELRKQLARDEEIRQEAVKATEEEAEGDRLAAQRVIADAKANEQQARDDAAQDAKDAETKRLNDIKEVEDRHAKAQEKEKAEQERIASDQRKRESDTKHKASINRSILKEFHKLGASEHLGRNLITAIAQGKIDYIKINY